MQKSRPAKVILNHLPILVVLAATVVGLLLGEKLYPTSLDSQPGTPPAQIQLEQTDLQTLRILGTFESCEGIFLSYPPKCKTLDGEFIPMPGTSPYILTLPEDK